MLKLWEHFVTNVSVNSSEPLTRLFIGVLSGASGAAVTHQINGDYTLSFKYPKGGRYAAAVTENRIIECEGQLFRIVRPSRSQDALLNVSCTHVFNYDAARTHIPNIASTDTGDFIGVSAYDVLKEAVRIANKYLHTKVFSLFDNEELEALGLTAIDVKIDFDSLDKTNLYDVILKIIECAGKGELYVDNYRFAIVERIGRDTDMTLSTSLNMSGISIEKDISEMITRLFVYGKDDVTIAAASGNTDGKPYIDSDTNKRYGIFCGYKDYPDYTDPNKLWERALWEFDEANQNRIDVPSVNISGSMLDLARIGKSCVRLNLGDGVRVLDNGDNIYERVLSITRYPYEAEVDSVSIGRMKKDMFFYLNQIGLLAKRYKNTSTYNGKIQGTKIIGTVAATSAATTATTALSVRTSDGVNISGSTINLRGNVLSVNADGNLCVNGKKIMIEEVGDGGAE